LIILFRTFILNSKPVKCNTDPIVAPAMDDQCRSQLNNPDLKLYIINLPTEKNQKMPYKERPVEKLYYTIGEVSRMLDVPVSTVRFWENEFDILKPMKNKKGNRMFTATDLRNLMIIHRLTKEEGVTLAGVKKRLEGNWDEADRNFRIYESLQKIKSLLIELRDNI
jgi:DNA-binding transcriptional MerR regulator